MGSINDHLMHIINYFMSLNYIGLLSSLNVIKLDKILQFVIVCHLKILING